MCRSRGQGRVAAGRAGEFCAGMARGIRRVPAPAEYGHGDAAAAGVQQRADVEACGPCVSAGAAVLKRLGRSMCEFNQKALLAAEARMRGARRSTVRRA